MERPWLRKCIAACRGTCDLIAFVLEEIMQGSKNVRIIIHHQGSRIIVLTSHSFHDSIVSRL